MCKQPDAATTENDSTESDSPSTPAGEINITDIPDDITDVTRALARRSPPTNPVVVLNAARWWYMNGRGGTDPAFQWAVEWTHHLATQTPSDTERYSAFLKYLIAIGFAPDRQTLIEV